MINTINIEMLQATYLNHDNKEFIDLIGTNESIQNDLRMTDLKMYSVNIEQVYEYFNTDYNVIIVSKDDLLTSIDNIKNSNVWNEITKKHNITKTVTFEQHKKLEGLLFWLRERKILENYNQCTKQAKENITYKINECDRLNIPHSIQNLVLNAYNSNNVHMDILDILRPNNIKTVYN